MKSKEERYEDLEKKLSRAWKQFYAYPPPSGKKILHYLSTLEGVKNREKGAERPEIKREAGLSYARVWENVKLLKNDGYILGEKVRKSKRGDDVFAYRLARPGLDLVLRLPKEIWKEEGLTDPWRKIEKIFRAYPQFFPKELRENWSYIKAEGVDSFVIKTYRREITIWHSGVPADPFDGLMNVFVLNESIIRGMGESNLLDPEAYLELCHKWMKAVLGNDDLRIWALRHLEKIRRDKKREIAQAEESINELSRSRKGREEEKEGGEKEG